jgi:hypothetical protein
MWTSAYYDINCGNIIGYRTIKALGISGKKKKRV